MDLYIFTQVRLSVLSPVPDYVKATVETVMKIHETEDDGDVLAFLTGQVSDQGSFEYSDSVVVGSRRCKIKSAYEYAIMGQLFFLISLLNVPVGGGGESGVPSAGPGQVFVAIWHEEAPEDFADVLWSTIC